MCNINFLNAGCCPLVIPVHSYRLNVLVRNFDINCLGEHKYRGKSCDKQQEIYAKRSKFS